MICDFKVGTCHTKPYEYDVQQHEIVIKPYANRILRKNQKYNNYNNHINDTLVKSCGNVKWCDNMP